MRRALSVVVVFTWIMGGAAQADPKQNSAAARDKEGLSAMGKVPKSCVFKGKKLWGKVKIVDSFPDFKVQVVSSFPDLKVQKVTSFPDKCGKWQFVKSFPDFKVKFVTSFPDFKIKYVTSFPGVP